MTQERKLQGYTGKSDADEELPKEERKQVIKETLKEKEFTEAQAELERIFTLINAQLAAKTKWCPNQLENL